ncbi:hypothetical protein K502DRAFT_367467 [Neoconidiobolus thromboides FSU 785]|nr:hypothetical protein K502DRAFT_367467 [Neoconidiobolus thromboides FSU 785]
MSKVKVFLNVHDLEPSRSVESNLVPKKGLLIIRGILSLFQFIVLVLLIVQNYNSPLTFGMFLTNFGFYGLSIYIWWSFYLSVRAVRHTKRYQPFETTHYTIHFIYQLLYESMLIYHFIISIIYWSLLANSEVSTLPSLALFLTIARHLFNFVFMLIEFLFSRNTVYFSHYPILLLFGILYICLALLIHSINDVWAYPFLDYKKSPLTFGLVIGGIFIFSLLYYLLLSYLHKLRDRLFAKRYVKVSSMVTREP